MMMMITVLEFSLQTTEVLWLGVPQKVNRVLELQRGGGKLMMNRQVSNFLKHMYMRFLPNV